MSTTPARATPRAAVRRFANRLAAFRLAADLTQRALEHAAHVSATTVSRMEHGRGGMPIAGTLDKLATALSASLGYTITAADLLGTGTRNPPVTKLRPDQRVVRYVNRHSAKP